MFKSYVDPEEGQEAKRKLPKLMFEGLLLGGTGLGVLALIFEIAADAFSVAAYQTLLAIYGAQGYHQIAIAAFILLSILLFLGIVPAYKAGAYLRPNAGGSGPLVEAIGPPKLRWLSWIGTSLFFLDAVLTIIISAISASDVTMLVLPELAPYRILLAEGFAFFIMVVLVSLGPKRAVPLFLMGGGAFTMFTILALTIVGITSIAFPEWSFLTGGIVYRLQASGVAEEVVRATRDLSAIGTVLIFQLFFRSMSSAMLGFSGYEVIPASGKHAARPKWKVINTALTLAAIFLIGTGVVQLVAANQWKIPATEGYSTLLIQYEIDAVQVLGEGLTPEDIVVTEEDRVQAEEFIAEQAEEHGSEVSLLFASELAEDSGEITGERLVDLVAYEVAVSNAIDDALLGTPGATFLFIAGTLLAVILLLAQGGGYIGGAAVAANAARLGRLPGFFADDRIGIAVIWGVATMLIPVIRQVVVVEAYYAFGFVSAFTITSTTVFLVRNDVLKGRGIEPGSSEAKSLRFAGLRGMIASYFMMVVLITQKTDALPAIIIAGAAITLFQVFYSNGGLKRKKEEVDVPAIAPGAEPDYSMGLERAYDQARQRGIADAVKDLIKSGALAKFNVGPARVIQLVCYLYNIDPDLFVQHGDHHDHIEEPSIELEQIYQKAYEQQDRILRRIEDYSHYGIFMFINNYHINWVDLDHGRDATVVQKAMLDILFPLTPHAEIWAEFLEFEPRVQPEEIWQFSRRRYVWAKDQWPNLSDRITTIWTLQDFGLIPEDIDVKTIITVADGKRQMHVKIPGKGSKDPTRTAEEISKTPPE
ncbi:MAG: hypothetical protein R3293_05800 [Candidatus Promineifilaceae bacterium]|nr:hypothetical protein [Candidatus Promineifilaceae bacterium]